MFQFGVLQDEGCSAPCNGGRVDGCVGNPAAASGIQDTSQNLFKRWKSYQIRLQCPLSQQKCEHFVPYLHRFHKC